jgi:hypothetical protein
LCVIAPSLIPKVAILGRIVAIWGSVSPLGHRKLRTKLFAAQRTEILMQVNDGDWMGSSVKWEGDKCYVVAE